jgi:hypothetical protein
VQAFGVLYKKPPFFTFEHQTCKTPCRIGARVYINAVWQNLWLSVRRMTMHDNFAEILVTFEKNITDPEQVLLTLPFKLYPGANARVTKEIISDDR